MSSLASPIIELAPGLRGMEPTAEALFRSTLGRSSRGSLNAPAAVDIPAPVYDTPEPAARRYSISKETRFSDEVEHVELPLARGQIALGTDSRRLKTLDWQLVVYSMISMSLATLFFLLPTTTSPFSVLPHGLLELLPPSWLIGCTLYASLLLAFRSGVRAIALSVDCDESEDGEGMYCLEAEEAEGQDVAALALTGFRGVMVQGLTLFTATALLHLPVHALQQLPLLVGFVGWCLSTTVCGLIMWDAIRQAGKECAACQSDRDRDDDDGSDFDESEKSGLMLLNGDEAV